MRKTQINRIIFILVLTLSSIPTLGANKCDSIFSTKTVVSKLSESVKRSVLKSRSREITVKIVVDTLMPVANRGNKPSLLVIRQNLQKIGLSTESTDSDKQEVFKVPANGFITLEVRGNKESLLQAAQIPQVIWISKVVSQRTINKLVSERSFKTGEIKLRRKIEQGIVDRFNIKSAKVEVQQLLEKEISVQREIEHLELELRINENNLDSNRLDLIDRIYTQDQIEKLEREIDNRYYELEELQEQIEKLQVVTEVR